MRAGNTAGACSVNYEYGSYVGTAATARDHMSVVDALGQDGLLHYYGTYTACTGLRTFLADRGNTGGSYGTALGATLAAMFPDRIGHMVVDGVIDAKEYYHDPAYVIHSLVPLVVPRSQNTSVRPNISLWLTKPGRVSFPAASQLRTIAQSQAATNLRHNSRPSSTIGFISSSTYRSGTVTDLKSGIQNSRAAFVTPYTRPAVGLMSLSY